MKSIIVSISVILGLVSNLQAAGPFLIHNGSTDFIIVLPNFPRQVEQVAANELKAYLDEITQTKWNIARENEVSEDIPQILIGNSARAKKFFSEIVQEDIPYDGIELHLKGNKLLLTGHEQRGTLYAVNTFLEEILGVRWWTSSEQFVPTHTTFELKPINISYVPKLIYREVHYKDIKENPVFAMRMKCNGHFPKIDSMYGGHQRFMYFCHSFYRLIPPDKYFSTHPEWFSEIDGKRTAYGVHSQLCLTNDEMRKELSKNAIDALRRNPQATFISISQNDGGGYCTCVNCKQVAEEESSQSGSLIRFVNRVAEDIEKEFPNVLVETLAYQYTLLPPKYATPRQNVVIRLCSFECSFIKPLTDSRNKLFRDAMQDWGKITKNLFIWDYVANFSSFILPYPNLRVLGPNIRFFVENETIGLFQDADSRCSVGDFVRMRNWIILRLMWNPTLDQNELMREFLEGYYGKQATPFLLEYFDTLINKAESALKHMGIYYEDTNDWLDYETLCRATALFDQAIAAAVLESGNDSEYVQRLRRERLPIEHVWLKEYYHFKEFAETNGKDFCGPADPVEACKNFRTFCDKYMVNSHCETCTPEMFEVYKENLCRQFANPPTPTSAQMMDNIEQTINITAGKLKNTTAPFEYQGESVVYYNYNGEPVDDYDKVDVISYLVKDWIHNEEAAGNGTVWKYWFHTWKYRVFEYHLGFNVWYQPLYPINRNLVNAKLYQTVELEAGKYQLKFFVCNSEPGYIGAVYVTAALGDDLPNVNEFDIKALAYSDKIPDGIGATLVSPFVASIVFGLSEKSTVSLGVVAHDFATTVLFSKVELQKIHHKY